MMGDFSIYARVTVTPDAATNLLTCENPLGVIPKMVHVYPSQIDNGGIADCVLTADYGGGVYVDGTGVNRYQNWSPEDSINPRTYLLTANAISIQRGGSATGKWLAGVTYTVHIYA
jgi:hypothetical protein